MCCLSLFPASERQNSPKGPLSPTRKELEKKRWFVRGNTASPDTIRKIPVHTQNNVMFGFGGDK